MYSTGSLVENGNTAGRLLARVGTVSRRQRRHVTQAVLIRNYQCILTYEIKRSVVVKEHLDWRFIGVQKVAGCIVRTVESPASP